MRGIAVAFTIIGLWASSLIFLIFLKISELHQLWIFPAIFWQTFLYTGLFITAHDAMHGMVFPRDRKINNIIGTVTVVLYALFPYNKLLKKHWIHHRHPASEIDPDFHDGKNKNFFSWYFHFMKGYWSWKQIIGISVIFNSFVFIIGIPIINLILFWVVPSILSSLQLFYFGTFLPHREPEEGYSNPHRAQSSHRSVFWSFITCYHFGYHEEHHEYPDIPWWQLPEIYRTQADTL